MSSHPSLLQEQQAEPSISATDLRPGTPPQAILQDGMTTPDKATVTSMNQSMKAGRSRYSSPPVMSSSMTPPPSSQMPLEMRSEMRTPTPTAPLLSSPPPTVKADVHATTSGGTAEPFDANAIARAHPEELRSMAHELLLTLREARTSAAHHKLQYNMLCIESSEAANRMAVELAMAQREVDVLQAWARKRNSADFQDIAASPSNSNMVNEMSRTCHMLQSENDELRRALGQSKSLIDQHEGDIARLVEENERLRGRIRKNREHMNNMFGHVYDQTPPRQTFGISPPTASRLRGSAFGTDEPSSGKERPFEALLLADKVLSQKTATAPSTPSRFASQKGRGGHVRGTHSLSSLPSTPSKSRGLPAMSVTNLQTPPTFSAINRIPQSAPDHYSAPARRRRESSDSTITASSVEDDDIAPHRDEIEESQASRAATTMLRRASMQKSSASFPEKSTAKLQSKLFGQVKKPGSARSWDEKSNLHYGKNPVAGSPSKRARLTGGVGLGIGGLGTG